MVKINSNDFKIVCNFFDDDFNMFIQNNKITMFKFTSIIYNEATINISTDDTLDLVNINDIKPIIKKMDGEIEIKIDNEYITILNDSKTKYSEVKKRLNDLNKDEEISSFEKSKTLNSDNKILMLKNDFIDLINENNDSIKLKMTPNGFETDFTNTTKTLFEFFKTKKNVNMIVDIKENVESGYTSKILLAKLRQFEEGMISIKMKDFYPIIIEQKINEINLKSIIAPRMEDV